MKAFVLIVRSTLVRLVRRRRVLGLTVLTGASAPMLFLVSWGRDDAHVIEVYHGLTVTLAMILAYPIASIVISTAAFGEERKAHTMPFLMLKPVSRWVISAAMTTAGAIASFVVMATGVGLTWIVASGFTGDWALGWPTLIAVSIQAIATAAIFVPIGLLISRATLVGLAYLFIWETILASAVAGFSSSSTFRIALSAYADLATLPRDLDVVDELLGNVTPGVGGAYAKVLVLLTISIAFTGMVLRRRDLAEE